MCGVLGSINIPISNQLLDTLKHRGPDDGGIIEFDVNSNSVYLGHRRLSILDLTKAGHQPMNSECNNYSIIFNGEIYNHAELKKKLTIPVCFKGHSDTETILYYIREFGIESISDFNGIFGFAFLDTVNNLLHIARDRFGVKPLYYHYHNNQLLVSSEIRPIKQSINPEMNFGAIGSCLRMRYFPSPLTPYLTIDKVEPGQVITIELLKNELKLTKKYFVNKSRKVINPDNEQRQLVKRYGDLFEKAVSKQLMADVDIGILLSGGIDSALVAAVAKSKFKHKLKAFTVGFSQTFLNIDESLYAKQTADILGLEHYARECSFADFLSSMKSVVQIVEEPIGTTSVIPMYFLSELASSRVKVVLSGQGADEPLGGYMKYKALPFLEVAREYKLFKSVVKLLEPLLKEKEHSRRLISAIYLKDKFKCYMEFNSCFSFEHVYELLNFRLIRSREKSFFDSEQIVYKALQNRNSEISRIKDLFLFCDLRTSLPDDLLMYTDKITMHFGLECRVPMLDNDLIEFIESLDSSEKYNFRKGKIIHKAFAKDYLPSAIINRRKIGFKSPTESWFRTHRELIISVLNSGNVFRDVFNMSKVMGIIDAHHNGSNLEKQIFLLLSFFYLLEDKSFDRKFISKQSIIA